MCGAELDPTLSVDRFFVRDNHESGLCARGRIDKAVCPIVLGFGLRWTVFGSEVESIIVLSEGDGNLTASGRQPTTGWRQQLGDFPQGGF